MKTINKYVLNFINKKKVVEIPSDTILNIGEEQDNTVVYSLVDTENKKPNKYEFAVYETNHPLTDDISEFTYLGSLKTCDHITIVHVFFKKMD